MAIFDRPTKWNDEADEQERTPFFTTERKNQMIYNGEEFFITECFKTKTPDKRGDLKWIIKCEMCMTPAGVEHEVGMLSFTAGGWRDEEMQDLMDYMKANKGHVEGPVYLRKKVTKSGNTAILITSSDFKDKNSLEGANNVPF